MSTQMQPASDRYIFRGTNRQKGRHHAVTPENSSMKHLVYGRIRLDGETPRVSFSTGTYETGLICMAGGCTVKANGEAHRIEHRDSIYIPRDTEVEIETEGHVDFVECSAEVEGQYPLQVVRFADIERDPTLRFQTGGPSTTRTINIALGKNVQAGRIVAGFTVSVPGHRINFVWLMAAHREQEDRQFGVVTVQPGFDQAGTGLEASRK